MLHPQTLHLCLSRENTASRKAARIRFLSLDTFVSFDPSAPTTDPAVFLRELPLELFADIRCEHTQWSRMLFPVVAFSAPNGELRCDVSFVHVDLRKKQDSNLWIR